MLKSEFRSNVIEIALRNGFSPVNCLYIFRTPFPKNTSGGLLLEIRYRKLNFLYSDTSEGSD